jgi:hypothetical protein
MFDMPGLAWPWAVIPMVGAYITYADGERRLVFSFLIER